MPPPMSMTSATFIRFFDDFDLVTDLGAAENRDKGARRIGDRFAEIGEFLFHEQAGGGLLDEAGDADYGSMRAMRGAKGITDEIPSEEKRTTRPFRNSSRSLVMAVSSVMPLAPRIARMLP